MFIDLVAKSCIEAYVSISAPYEIILEDDDILYWLRTPFTMIPIPGNACLRVQKTWNTCLYVLRDRRD